MKLNYIFLLILLSLFSCKENSSNESLLPGDFQIINSPQKEWFVHADISQWTEYNNIKNIYNVYHPIWYSDISFELEIIEKEGKPVVNSNKMKPIECSLQYDGESLILSKKWKKKQQKAELAETGSDNLKNWLGNHYSIIPLVLSKASLRLFMQIKTELYEQIYTESQFQNKIKANEFANLMQDLKKRFGQLLWIKALPNTYQNTDESYSIDFLCGFVNSHQPLVMHLQWNKSAKLINLSIQTGKNNASAQSKQLLGMLFSDARKGNYRLIYEKSSAVYKNETTIEQLPDKMIKMLQLSNEKSYQLNNLELDIKNYGNQWAYFFEFAEAETWIGINLTQTIGSANYQLDKIVIIE